MAAQQKKWKDARKDLEEAVRLFPRYAEAWYELSRALEQTKDYGRAREAYRQAVATDEKYVLPAVQLAGIAVREEKWDEVLDATARVVELEPSGYPGAYYMKAAAHFNRKEYADAEASAREAVKLDTDHRFPDANHIYGVLMMMRRDYQGAAEQLRLYLKLAPRAADAEMARGGLASCEKALKALEKQ